MSLGRNTNDTTGRASASVAGLLGLGVVRLAEVVSAGVNDNGALQDVVSLHLGERGREGQAYADDAVLADEFNQLICHAALGVALAICLEVA